MNTSLCLTFLHLAGSSITVPPPNIQDLVKQRIRHQWEAKNARNPLVFDDPTCRTHGTYHYTDRSIVLAADTDEWRGPLELNLTSVIEGENLPFERVSPASDLSNRFVAVSEASATEHSAWKTWLPWSLAAVGIAATAYALIERERHIHQLQGMMIRF